MTAADLQGRIQKAVHELADTGAETGVQVAVVRHGTVVADVSGGVADLATGRPVSAGSLFWAASTAKGIASTVVHVLAERGELDYDLHVADVWPEFAAHGKDTVTVRHLLCHTAGVPGLPPRRATGCTISELLRDLITGPLGIADEVRFGVPARLLPRVATQIDPEGLPESPPEPGSPQSPSMPTVIIPALDHQGATDE